MYKSLLILITLLLSVALSFTASANKPSENTLSKCPVITVSCPTTEQPYTFTAVLYDAESKSTVSIPNLEYSWTISKGEIASGQGTASMTVDASSTDMRALTATVDVEGLAGECKTRASCTTSPH
jgi:hypothetical protein